MCYVKEDLEGPWGRSRERGVLESNRFSDAGEENVVGGDGLPT